MSSSQSDLGSKQYGYDMVVGVTQVSVNATMEEWLSKVEEKTFILGYKFNPEAPDPKNPYYPIDDWDAFVSSLGFDPFTLPNNTKESDPKMAALMKEYFAFAFKAKIGLPAFPLDKIPPVITFDKEGSYVTYNMVNEVFQVIGVESPPYGERYWLNASQSDSDEVWDFQFTVDLDLRDDDLSNHFNNLPLATQQAIKNLGENMFSVQQLFLDLNTAALSNSYQIKGLDPTSTTYQMLCNVFLEEYFKELSKNGGVMLGFTVKASQPFPDNVSLIPTDLNFEISAYKDNGKATQDYDAYTLNYLIMSDMHTMPAPVPFTWNWVEKDNLSKEAGTMAVKRNTFRDFLSSKLSSALADLAHKPDCSFSCNLIKYEISTGFKQDTSPQKFQTCGSGSTLLTYSYYSSDKSSDTFVPNWGNWGVKYTASCNISVSGTVITVVANVKARCHLNIEGGVQEGDWASYEITTTYTIGVAADGTLVVTENEPVVKDKSENPDPSVWSEIVTFGTIDNCVNEVRDWLKPLLKNFGTGFENDIAAMLNGSNGWTFPGGKTYAFTGVEFSDYQDLVADLLYVTPKRKN